MAVSDPVETAAIEAFDLNVRINNMLARNANLAAQLEDIRMRGSKLMVGHSAMLSELLRNIESGLGTMEAGCRSTKFYLKTAGV
jgi:hypothetical protein